MDTPVRVWSRSRCYPHVVVTSLCLLLLTSGLVNCWQYRLIQQDAAVASANAKAAKVKVNQLQAELKQRYAKEAANKRVDRLYKEIDNLNHLSDRIFMEGQLSRKPRSARDDSIESASGR
jgi:hypothetical protein